MAPANKKYLKTSLSLILLLAIPHWTTAQPVKPIFPSTAGAWKVHKTNGQIMAENFVTGKVRIVFSEVDTPKETSRYDIASLVGPLLSVIGLIFIFMPREAPYLPAFLTTRREINDVFASFEMML